VARRTPNPLERALVKTWSERKKLLALRQHALDGHEGWVAYLLEQTDYRSYPALLSGAWWRRGAPPGEVAQRLTTARAVVRSLLKAIDRATLPPEIAERVPRDKFETDQVLLRLWPLEKYRL
jgi:hypothetical protein